MALSFVSIFLASAFLIFQVNAQQPPLPGQTCLDVTDVINADGTRLQIWTCASGNTNQLWEPEFGSVGNIFWVGKNKCVDFTNGNTTNGNQLQVWDCNTSNPNQIWGVLGISTPDPDR
ncbi:ricin B lectin domain-containing protein [Mycena epipterygia]|nr:ricin B lectin domain-containing protein [Mycena epipterygia]